MEELRIVYLRPEELTPYERNAKQHPPEQIEHIANSIREFGFRQPLVIDADNVVVIGHGRLLAAKMLGLDKVPCTRADDLTEAQIKALRLADNKTNESAWDFGTLDGELKGLRLDFDMSKFGFEIPGGVSDTEPTAYEDDFDVGAAVEAKAKQGDIYQLGRHRLMCGDSTDAEAVEKLMDGAKANMVFTDPPYGINAVSDDGKVGADFGVAQKGEYKQIIADDTTETAQKAYEVLSQICERLILWGGNYFLDFLPPSDGWLIWDKRGESGIRNTFADGEMAWCSFHTPVRIYHQLWNGMIREGEHEKRVHPTQKPVKMLGEVLQDFSKDNDNIVDLFGGSGSTLIACEQLNRTCYMMELDPHYVDVIIARWEALTGEKAVLLNAT